MDDLDGRGIRPAERSYVDDFRPQDEGRSREGRWFAVADTTPAAQMATARLNTQQLALAINYAILVGKGTLPMKDLATFLEGSGVRRLP